MSRICSNSFFHYTKSMGKLLGILQSGFRGHYCHEEFKCSDGEMLHLSIPMVSFCDIPLSHIPAITYGEYGIGMTSIWGNAKNLTPVCYFPNSTKKPLTRFIAQLAQEQKDEKCEKCNNLLAFAKPYNKYANPQGYRLNNYREREWRKAYNTVFIKNDEEDSAALSQNKPPKQHPTMLLTFSNADITFILVPNDRERLVLIRSIQDFKSIGGTSSEISDEDRLLLVSKILTIDDIKRNF